LTAARRYGYHSINMAVLLFFKALFVNTLIQMATFFAGFLVFGLLIQALSQLSFRSLEKSFGNKGTYVVAWLGTPIHELGHALFCLIFRHKIAEIRFFKPDQTTGTMGYVYHKWNTKNLWQVLGNFFIGIGPLILGCAVLFGLFYVLIPGSSGVWEPIAEQSHHMGNSIGGNLEVMGNAALTLLKIIFTADNLASWRFWVFLYLAICVSSNIRLSWSDVTHSIYGAGCIVVPFLLLNLVGLIFGVESDEIFPVTAASLGTIYSVLILALVMVLAGFIIIYTVAALNFRRKYKKLMRPF
jgi:hypothetical protein